MRTLVTFLLLAAPALAADPPIAPVTTKLSSADQRAPVTAVAWLPDGSGVVGGNKDGSVRVWTLADAKETDRLPAVAGDEGRTWGVAALAVNSDGSLIAVGQTVTGMADVRVWDRKSKRVTPSDPKQSLFSNTMTNISGAVRILTPEEDPQRIQQITFERETNVCRVMAGNEIIRLSPEVRPLAPAVVMPRQFGKGEKALIRGEATVALEAGIGVAYYEGDDVDEMRAWDFQKNELRSSVKLAERARPHAYSISPDGRFAVLGGVLETKVFQLRIYDVASWQEVANLAFKQPLPQPPTGTFSPDGRMYAVRVWDQPTQYLVYDTARWSPVATIARHGLFRSLAISPDGRRVTTGGTDSQVLIHDLRAAIDPKPPAFDAAACWADLVAADGAVAMRAVYRLADRPADAVKLFQEKLKPVVKPTAADVAAWVNALDAPAFADRQAATKKLTAVADAIEPELKAAAAKNASPEVAQALAAIRDGVAKSRRKLDGDNLRAYRVVQVLEMIGPPAAEALKAYAAGAKGAFLTQEAEAARGRGRP